MSLFGGQQHQFIDASKATDVFYLSEIVSKIVSFEGLEVKDHKQFWDVISSTSSAASYLAVLLVKLTALEIGDLKTALVDLTKKVMEGGEIIPNKGINKLSSNLNVPLKRRLMVTLYYVRLYFEYDPYFPPLNAALQRLEKSLIGKKGLDPFVEELLRLLGTGSGGMSSGSGGNYTDRIIGYVEQCTDIRIPGNFDFLEDSLSTKMLIGCYFNGFLRHSLDVDVGMRDIIFDNLLLFLRHPGLSEERMMCLLHMLHHFMIQVGGLKREMIIRALNEVKQHYLRPRPYGDVARDVLQLLTVELKSPGAALRRAIFGENPSLVPGHLHEMPKEGATAHHKEREVHFFCDCVSHRTGILQDLLASVHLTDPSLQQLQLDILVSALNENRNPGCRPIQQDDIMMKFSPILLENFYCAAVEILNEAVLLNQQDAEEFRMKELSALIVEIEELPPQPPDQTHTHPIPTVPRPPKLPPLHLESLTVSCNNMAPVDLETPFPKRETLQPLLNLILANKVSSTSSNSPGGTPSSRSSPIKLAIVGGDSTLHNILCSYARLRIAEAHIFEGVEVQFYMVPTEPSDFASFLGRKDIWYGRHVILAIHGAFHCFPSAVGIPQSSAATLGKTAKKSATWSPSSAHNNPMDFNDSAQRRPLSLFFPRDDSNATESENQSENSAPPSPALLLYRELEYFFREARWRLDVNIYKCECWKHSSGRMSMVIPFILRADIGYRTAARMNQVAKDLPTDLSEEKFLNQKFKFSPPNVSIKYNHMNVLNQERQGTPLESRPYYQITVGNIPPAEDLPQFHPNPTKAWLDVFLLETDPKKKKKGVEESGTSLHVSFVELEAEEKRKTFPILLDNVIYGPFQKIRISPVRKGEEILTIPFMTFFPLDL